MCDRCLVKRLCGVDYKTTLRLTHAHFMPSNVFSHLHEICFQDNMGAALCIVKIFQT